MRIRIVRTGLFLLFAVLVSVVAPLQPAMSADLAMRNPAELKSEVKENRDAEKLRQRPASTGLIMVRPVGIALEIDSACVRVISLSTPLPSVAASSAARTSAHRCRAACTTRCRAASRGTARSRFPRG